MLIELAKEGKMRRFGLEADLLGIVFMCLNVRNCAKKIMKECHDSRWAGYPVYEETLVYGYPPVSPFEQVIHDRIPFQSHISRYSIKGILLNILSTIE
ncbi:hypothetical protein EPI10_028175 [Gossypium australe]|uniref:Uncharacterized protein n=1 Tax=Gossypium australe TaxID=47621 RepID=A0A5B6UX46_9ROSI|nr:hypothetical protein EPI10_028175 [Gossypium australe]